MNCYIARVRLGLTPSHHLVDVAFCIANTIDGFAFDDIRNS